jgi:hypothetical protein
LYCGPDYEKDKNQNNEQQTSLPERRPRKRVRRIYDSIEHLAEGAPINSYAGTVAGQRHGIQTIESLEVQKLYVSGICHQSSVNAEKGMVYLLPQSSYRTGNQGTQKRFYHQQNTNRTLPGQSDIFPFTVIGLQSGQLVYTFMSAKTISFMDIADTTFKSLGITGENGKRWQQKHSPASGKLRVPEPLWLRFVKDQKTENHIICEICKPTLVGLN